MTRSRAFVLRYVLVLLLGLAGCGRPNYSSEKVAGRWELSDGSRYALPTAIRTAAGLLLLKDDGHFTVSEIPAGLAAWQEKDSNQLASGSGSRHLAMMDNRQVLRLDFDEIIGVPVGGTPFGTQVYLSGDERKTFLYYFQSDPDNSLEIDFEKL